MSESLDVRVCGAHIDDHLDVESRPLAFVFDYCKNIQRLLQSHRNYSPAIATIVVCRLSYLQVALAAHDTK